ncbi:MAG: galactokinase family protein [Zestosphaera sp.]
MASASKVSLVKRRFRELFNLEPEVIASAPGRLDFLNTHQDYKGLPVVSVAIDRRAYVAVARSGGSSRVVSLNICVESGDCIDSFNFEEVRLRGRGFFGDYIRSVVMSLRETGVRMSNFHMLIDSDVPMASGLASSAALQVAAIASLTRLFNHSLSLHEIAELAYRSEHDVVGIPCGRLDQYGSTMGGVTLVETKPSFNTRTFRGLGLSFVVLDSGIRHSTREVHPVRISELSKGIREILSRPDLPQELRRRLSEDVYETDWQRLTLEELRPHVERVSSVSRRRILFTLKMNTSTNLALKLLENASESVMSEVGDFLVRECRECLEVASKTSNNMLKLLGGVINYQHALLRDLYDVSLPQLELIREKALEGGALGVKISGAGLGGSMFALIDTPQVGHEVVSRVRDLVRGAWIVREGEGVKVEYESRFEA